MQKFFMRLVQFIKGVIPAEAVESGKKTKPQYTKQRFLLRGRWVARQLNNSKQIGLYF